jgi:hypothetical protein
VNIQLRDSKTLQDALIEATKKSSLPRNALPKAQLHPELLNGIVDVDGGGFVVHTEQNKGDHKGEVNAIDAWNMEQFLPQPMGCEAKWVFTARGKNEPPVPFELIFTFENQSKVAIRTQCAPDLTKLTSALPPDRTARYDACYDAGSIVFVRAANQPELPSVTKTTAHLRLDAAKAGVAWDPKASAETMVERIEKATKAPKQTAKV